MQFAKAVFWFLIYLSLQVAGGLLIFQTLFWAVGEEKLFSIPLIYPMFKVCPLVFLGMSYQLARRKVYGNEEESPSSAKSQSLKSKAHCNSQTVTVGRRIPRLASSVLVLGILAIVSISFFVGHFSTPQNSIKEDRRAEKQTENSEDLAQFETDEALTVNQEAYIEGDPDNIPYQKYVVSRLNKLNAGDLYGKEREEAILLIRRYASECKEAGVDMFTYERIEEEIFLRSVYQDLKKWKILRPEEWKEISITQAFMQSEKSKNMVPKMELNQRYLAWTTGSSVQKIASD